MKILTNLILAASIVSLAACSESKEVETAGIGTTPVNFSSPSTTSQVSNSKGLNPAHGQPGHRCDIPVGASLSTPVQQATTAPAGIAPVTSPTASNAVAPGTNPAHGQPGHDCSIPVGDPLNK